MKSKNVTHGKGVRDLPQDNNCPIQIRWKAMVRRCYSSKFHQGHPSYSDKEVCEEWLLLSRYKAWMEAQNWEGLELDKDILIKGNKLYRPEACCFVPSKVNNVLIIKGKDNGLPIGVCVSRNGDKFRARHFSNGKDIHLGIFTNPASAHKAWQIAKAEEIEKTISWYATQACFRTDVADALMRRVWDLRLEYANGVETVAI